MPDEIHNLHTIAYHIPVSAALSSLLPATIAALSPLLRDSAGQGG
jgi:hypothetical protein